VRGESKEIDELKRITMHERRGQAEEKRGKRWVKKAQNNKRTL